MTYLIYKSQADASAADSPSNIMQLPPPLTVDETPEEILARVGVWPGQPWSHYALVSDEAMQSRDRGRLRINWATGALADAPSGIAELQAYAAQRRRSVIGGGTTVTVGQQLIPTWADADTQSALTGLVVAAQAGLLTQAVNWRGSDGQFYTIAPTDVIDLAHGVMTFVQTAFGVESYLVGLIEGGTITTPTQIDAAPWPSV